MSNDIDSKKEQAFNKISEILLSVGTPEIDGMERTAHIFDVLEQLLARAISGSSLEDEHIDEICEESFKNVKEMAKVFLEEEKKEQIVSN